MCLRLACLDSRRTLSHKTPSFGSFLHLLFNLCLRVFLCNLAVFQLQLICLRVLVRSQRSSFVFVLRGTLNCHVSKYY